MKSFIDKKYLFGLLGVLFIFVLWVIGEKSFNNDFIIPSISKTVESLLNLLGEGHTYKVLGYSLLRLLIVISVCFVGGVLLGVISNLSSQFKAFIKPFFTLMKTLPIAVLIILLLLMLNQNSLYFIAGFVVLPIIYEATVNGLESIDKNIVEEVRMNTNITPYVIGKIYLPLTLPYLITSLLQSVGLGLKVLVMAEFFANEENSIGYEIMFYKNDALDMSYVYAWSIILVLFVLGIDFLINNLKKKLA